MTLDGPSVTNRTVYDQERGRANSLREESEARTARAELQMERPEHQIDRIK